MSLSLVLTVLLLSATPLACSGATDEGGPPAADAGADQVVSDAAAGDPEVLVGTFLVEVEPPAQESPGATTVFGKVYDGPTPLQYVWEQTAQDGDCELLEPRVPFCAEPCGGTAICVEDDTCQAYPTAHEVGAVAVSGILSPSGANGFSMEPVNASYQAASGVIAWPPFAQGDAVRFDAAGGDFAPAFSLQAKGVLPLELASENLVLASDAPLELAWAAGDDGVSVIHVKLDISHHGGTKGMIVCDTQDTGALTIPAVLMTELIELGVAGFPTIVVTRQSTGSAVIPAGRVDLVVSSTVETSVEIPGVTSCNGDEDCPDGTTCQKDYTCQ